jgi:hypothetical protein
MRNIGVEGGDIHSDLPNLADSIFFLKSTKPITQVDQLSLLAVIPLKKSQDLWISTFVNMLELPLSAGLMIMSSLDLKR